MRKFLRSAFLLLPLLLVSSLSLRAQTVINGNLVFVPGGSLSTQLTNDGSTGTVLHKIAKLTGSGTAVRAGTSDTDGLIGIVSFGAGTSGRSSIVQVGQVVCVFDGATTANHYVIASTSVAGDCADGGASLPTVQNLGRVLSTNGSAGTFSVLVSVSGGLATTATISGSIASGQIGVGAGTNTLSGSSALTSTNGGIYQVVPNQSTYTRTISNTAAVAGTLTREYILNNGTYALLHTTDSFATYAYIAMTTGGYQEFAALGASNGTGIALNPASGNERISFRAANPLVEIYTELGNLCFNGTTSGSACMRVGAVAGSPAVMLWPTATASDAFKVLSSDAGSPQQLSWVTRVKVSGAIVPGECALWVDAQTIGSAGGSCAGGGGSGVTNVSSGNLSPLFTVAITNPTTTPAFAFTLSTAAAHKVFMNNTGSTAAPGFQTIGTADIPATLVYTDASATFGAFTYDFSGATIFKVKTASGYAPTVDGQCGVNTTTHLFVCGFNSASTITIPVTKAAVSNQFLTSYTQTTGAFTAAQPTLADIAAGSAPTGLFDFSAGTFKLPVAAGGTVTANGNVRYNSTTNNWLAWGNSISNFINVTPLSITPVNDDCVKWTVSSGVFTTNDQGYKCVQNFSDLNSFSNGVNNQTGAGYTILLSDGGKDVTLSNAGSQTVILPSSVPSSGWWVDIQNIGAGTWTSNRNGHTIDGGTTNFVITTGLGLRVYSDGSNYYTQRGMGSTASGSVTSVALAGPTGFTISGSPVTSTGTLTFGMPTGWILGDILTGNGSNSVTRLAGNTTTTPSLYSSTGNGSTALAPALITSIGGGTNPVLATFTSASQSEYLCENASTVMVNCVSGVGINSQTGTSYTVLGGSGGTSDRGKFVTVSNAAANAVTLPQAGTSGFANNFYFTIKNIGAGAATITPAASTIDGNASLKLLSGQSATIFSDDSNYFSTVRGYAIATSSSVSGAITGPGCDTTTVTINGAAVGMGVSVNPNTYPGDGIFWHGYVSSANTVTVKVCSDVNQTPTASTYFVKLLNP